jgi:hypothetical protein
VAPCATKSQPIRNFRASVSVVIASGRRGRGTPTALGFPENAVALVGTLSFYEVIGDSGKTVSRGFCPKCGSPVLWKFAVNPGVAVITAGSLDNPGIFKPQAVLYASQGHAWDHLNPELPKFEKLPPRD